MDIVRKKPAGMVVWDEWQKSCSEVSFHAVKNKHIWVYVCLPVYMHIGICVCVDRKMGGWEKGRKKGKKEGRERGRKGEREEGRERKEKRKQKEEYF